jgi:KDO2-lipid IV(A) lauroyltransferase
MPFGLLYRLSDFISFILIHLFPYRKSVVEENLSKSFPNKSTTQIKAIRNAYYKHLVDVSLETFKICGMSPAQIQKRFQFTNAEMLVDLMQPNQPLILVMGHCGNWEWGGTTYSTLNPFDTYTLYHPLSSPFFEWYTYKIRSHFKLKLLPMQKIARAFGSINNTSCMIAFVADQSPPPENAFWTKFLNQETAFFTGYAKLAIKHKCPVAYASVTKKGRGYYQSTFHIISEASNTETDIIHKFVTMLEKDIQAEPQYWLWSHRRWKHKLNLTQNE